MRGSLGCDQAAALPEAQLAAALDTLRYPRAEGMTSGQRRRARQTARVAASPIYLAGEPQGLAPLADLVLKLGLRHPGQLGR